MVCSRIRKRNSWYRCNKNSYVTRSFESVSYINGILKLGCLTFRLTILSFIQVGSVIRCGVTNRMVKWNPSIRQYPEISYHRWYSRWVNIVCPIITNDLWSWRQLEFIIFEIRKFYRRLRVGYILRLGLIIIVTTYAKHVLEP